MVEALEYLTYGTIPFAFLFLAATVFQHAQLIRTLGMGTEGRLMFWQSLTLKAWVALFLSWVLASTAFGPFDLAVRRAVNLTFALLLVAQAATSFAINHRWRKPKEQ